MKLLIIPTGSSFILPFDEACKEQKNLKVIIGLMFPKVSNSLADRNVVGGKVSFPLPFPLIKIILDIG